MNGDFEDAGAFDLSGTDSYCTLGTVLSWTNTHSVNSLFAAAIPSGEHFACPIGIMVFPSFAVHIGGAVPGTTYPFTYWAKATTLDYQACVQVYAYYDPASGALPASEWDLVSFGFGSLLNPDTQWTQFASQMEVPSTMPVGADVFAIFSFQQSPGSAPGDYFIIDDLEFGGIGVSVGQVDETPALHAYPDPATETMRITGLQLGIRMELIGPDGRCWPLPRTGDAETFTISHLPPGAYLFRQGERSARFITL
jgi:hypothetical protein